VKRILCILTLFLSVSLLAGGNEGNEEIVKTSLQIVDAETGLPIIGADVHVADQVFYTDPDGFVEISHNALQNAEVEINYISYQDKHISLNSQPGVVKVALLSR